MQMSMTVRSLQGLKQAAKMRLPNSVKEGESKEKEALLCRGQQSTAVGSTQRGKRALNEKQELKHPIRCLAAGEKPL